LQAFGATTNKINVKEENSFSEPSFLYLEHYVIVFST